MDATPSTGGTAPAGVAVTRPSPKETTARSSVKMPGPCQAPKTSPPDHRPRPLRGGRRAGHASSRKAAPAPPPTGPHAEEPAFRRRVRPPWAPSHALKIPDLGQGPRPAPPKTPRPPSSLRPLRADSQDHVGKNGIEGPPPNAGMKPNHRHKMATIEKKERASREGGNPAAAPCARTGTRVGKAPTGKCGLHRARQCRQHHHSTAGLPPPRPATPPRHRRRNHTATVGLPPRRRRRRPAEPPSSRSTSLTKTAAGAQPNTSAGSHYHRRSTKSGPVKAGSGRQSARSGSRSRHRRRCCARCRRRRGPRRRAAASIPRPLHLRAQQQAAAPPPPPLTCCRCRPSPDQRRSTTTTTTTYGPGRHRTSLAHKPHRPPPRTPPSNRRTAMDGRRSRAPPWQPTPPRTATRPTSVDPAWELPDPPSTASDLPPPSRMGSSQPPPLLASCWRRRRAPTKTDGEGTKSPAATVIATSRRTAGGLGRRRG